MAELRRQPRQQRALLSPVEAAEEEAKLRLGYAER